jgi:hypothetical protein
MPDLSKVLFNLGADWLTTITRQQLRRGTNFAHRHDRVLKKLLPSLAPTTQGKALGLRSGMHAAQFRADIPLSRPETIAPYVAAMRAGKPNIMWPDPTELFAATAGTTTGTPRFIPVTPAMVEHFYRASRHVALNASARAGNIDALRGRSLLIGGHSSLINSAAPPPRSGSFPTTADLSTLAATYKSNWIAHHYFEPTARIALETDWTAMVDRTIRRTKTREISLIAGQPQWLLAFGQQLLDSCAESARRPDSLHAVWPGLRCLIHTGSSHQTSRQALQRLAGPKVMLHEVYAAAEGIFAVQGHKTGAGLRLMTDAEIYFEFLPVSDYHPQDLAASGRKTVPLPEVKTMTDYLIVVTTPAGLVRYIVGDIVRFTSLRPHYLYPVGSFDLRLTSFGENLVARDLTTALLHTCEANRWQIRHFHVAPLPHGPDLGRSRGRHEWWVELNAGSTVTPTGPLISAKVDLQLCQNHPHYAELRRSGVIDEPLVRLVMPGAFEHWLRHHKLWGGPHKLPATRNDRIIADGLTELVRFSNN